MNNKKTKQILPILVFGLLITLLSITSFADIDIIENDNLKLQST